MRPGAIEVIQILLEHGANPNLRVFGTPLIVRAAGSGHDELVLSLIKHGADVNAEEEACSQATALMWAASLCKRETVQALVESGADVNALSSNGYSPQGWALDVGRMENAAYLKQAGGVVSPDFSDPRNKRRFLPNPFTREE